MLRVLYFILDIPIWVLVGILWLRKQWLQFTLRRLRAESERLERRKVLQVARMRRAVQARIDRCEDCNGGGWCSRCVRMVERMEELSE